MGAEKNLPWGSRLRVPLLTLLTIHLIPRVVEGVGWTYAFAFLAPGPLIGVIAMWRLRQHPGLGEARRGGLR